MNDFVWHLHKSFTFVPHQSDIIGINGNQIIVAVCLMPLLFWNSRKCSCCCHHSQVSFLITEKVRPLPVTKWSGAIHLRRIHSGRKPRYRHLLCAPCGAHLNFPSKKGTTQIIKPEWVSSAILFLILEYGFEKNSNNKKIFCSWNSLTKFSIS